MSCFHSKRPAQPIAVSLPDIVTVVSSTHFVCFINDDQIPIISRVNLFALFGTLQSIDSRDREIILAQRIQTSRSRPSCPVKQRELDVEFFENLVLPLFSKVGWYYDQTAAHIIAEHEFTQKEACHDSLAGTGVISEQEAQWLTWKHGFVDSRELMWQWIDERCVDSHLRVKEPRKSDSISLCNEPELLGVTFHGPHW